MKKSELALDQIQGIEKLDAKELSTVKREENLLTEATEQFEMSSIEIGEHLSNISKILTPKRIFNKWLTAWRSQRKRKLSRAWAYQLMQDYEAMKAQMPKPVLDMALEKGVKLSPKILVTNPPPPTTDRTKLAEYIDRVKTVRVEVVKPPDVLLKEVVNFFVLRYEQLPNNHKTRAAFVRSVIGMVMAKAGISTQAFEPMAIPETFRGRKAA